VLAGSSNYYFQSLIANKIQQDKFTMLTDDGSTYGMTASVSTAPQTISIQGESISCYRVDMKPDLWIFASLFPNMAFYFRTDPPYNFVRYEGPESGVSSPVIVQEVAAP
jgi:hypothetical protein